MADGTTHAVVHFSSTFELPNFDAPQPPGSYRVGHDEDSIESVLRARVASGGIFHSPAGGTTHQMAPINPADLDAALERDRRNDDGFDHSSA